MATFQIEATIEKIVQGENPEQPIIFLKGAGEYLFEKKKDKEYWNIFEWKSEEELSTKQDQAVILAEPPEKQLENPPISVKYNQPIYFEGIFKDLLIPAFIEKKSLKFTLEEKDGKFTITAVSHAST